MNIPGAQPSPSAPAMPVPRTTAPTPEPTVRLSDAWTDLRATEQAVRAATARQSSGRRRYIDPTTCERDYSREEVEFMQAMQEYKKRSGRMFPTWSEVLEVVRELGYEKSAGDSASSPSLGQPASIG